MESSQAQPSRGHYFTSLSVLYGALLCSRVYGAVWFIEITLIMLLAAVPAVQSQCSP